MEIGEKMRILITGGNGYIGTNLIHQYKDKVDFDICDYGNPSIPLAHQLELKNIEKYDAIVHLAALSGITACEEKFIGCIISNVMTAGNVFKQASQLQIPVVFTSSQAAKDMHSSNYANSKATCEALAKHYNNYGGMNYVIRLSNVYGGVRYLEKKQTCVKQFITKYKEGKPLEIHGSGTQLRDFIHVWDVCDAIMLLLEKLPSDRSLMDIGTGIGTSILDLLNMFPKNDLIYSKNRAGTDSSIAYVTTAIERIEFRAERKLEDYIKKMIN